MNSEDEKQEIRISLVGASNAGKSSFLNFIDKQNKILVSPEIGTTRDCIESYYHYENHDLCIIDTAGIRRAQILHKRNKQMEFLSHNRTQKAIQSSDIIIYLMDSLKSSSQIDKRALNQIEKYKIPCVVAINKWDVFHIGEKDPHAYKYYLQELYRESPYLKKVPIFFCSAKTGKNIEKIFKAIIELYHKAQIRIPTPQLNKNLSQWNKVIATQNQGLKIRYMTQIDIQPPSFVIMVNKQEYLKKNILSFLENQIRTQYSWDGIPIVIQTRTNNNRNIERKIETTRPALKTKS